MNGTWGELSFFQRVYTVVCAIPPGQVATYGQVAAIVGRTRGARVVGYALHALSDEQSEHVPWWRVINAQGMISTSCVEHGAARQKAKLVAEGVPFDREGRVPLEGYRWPVASETEFLLLQANEERTDGR